MAAGFPNVPFVSKFLVLTFAVIIVLVVLLDVFNYTIFFSKICQNSFSTSNTVEMSIESR